MTARIRPSRRASVALASWLAAALLVPVAAFTQSEMVIHTQGTKLYHRAGCPELQKTKDILAMTRAQAEARGYKPHDACDPADPASPGPDKAAPVPTVYLDGSRHYHRNTCSRLPADKDTVKAVSLEVAGKSHWPCPECKPPIRSRGTGPAVPGTERRGR
jgi:hypothetical protein